MSIIFPVKIQGVDVWVGSHDAPHADEAGAWWLIKKYADLNFLNRYSVWETIGGKKYQIIWVGTKLGPLDEHRQGGNECSMSLTAKALKIYEYPPLKRIVDAICQQDLKGGGELLGIIRAVNAMSRMNPQDPRETLDWFAKSLESIYAEEVGFYEAEQEFPRIVVWKRLARNGKDIYLAVIRSDSVHMAKVAFSKGAAIVLQRNSKGLTQIQARSNIPLGEVSGWLGNFEPDRWHLKGGLLLNGSISYPDVPSSQCTLEKIEEVIRYYLED